MRIIPGIVVSALLFSQHAHAQQNIDVCVGGEAGNYHWVMQQLTTMFASEPRLSGKAKYSLVNTKGSEEILIKLARNECQLGMAQYDAFTALSYGGGGIEAEPMMSNVKRFSAGLYPEWVHLLCHPKSGISSANDLTKKHQIAIVPHSGAALTWAWMTNLDDDYKDVSIIRAEDNDDAFGMVADFDAKDFDPETMAHCAIAVTGLGSGSMRTLDSNEGKLKLIEVVEFEDWDFNDAENAKTGQRVYTFKEMPGSTYQNLIGFWDVETITVDAVIYANASWMKENRKMVRTLKRIIRLKAPGIVKQRGLLEEG